MNFSSYWFRFPSQSDLPTISGRWKPTKSWTSPPRGSFWLWIIPICTFFRRSMNSPWFPTIAWWESGSIRIGLGWGLRIWGFSWRGPGRTIFSFWGRIFGRGTWSVLRFWFRWILIFFSSLCRGSPNLCQKDTYLKGTSGVLLSSTCRCFLSLYWVFKSFWILG